MDEVGFNHLAAPDRAVAAPGPRPRGRPGAPDRGGGRVGARPDLAARPLRVQGRARGGRRRLRRRGPFARDHDRPDAPRRRQGVRPPRRRGRRVGRRTSSRSSSGAGPDLLAVSGLGETIGGTAVRHRSRAPMVRTHGDLHLGRIARTNQGWVVADWHPGGADAGGGHPLPLPAGRRGGHALVAAATWPSPPSRSGTRPCGRGSSAAAKAWAARNRAGVSLRVPGHRARDRGARAGRPAARRRAALGFRARGGGGQGRELPVA